MKTTKRKPNWPLIALGALLSTFLGYLAAGVWTEGMSAYEFALKFSEAWKSPFENYFCGYTPKGIVLAEFFYAMAVTVYYTSQKNLMPGREFGTARLASAAEVSRDLRDKNDARNRVYSQNLRMSLDTRHTKLNNNVLIIGGAGSGKTFYEVKPNLMQMPERNSFVITDPKGEILRSTGHMLKNNGYRVKVINLLEMERSDCYNPFSYIREETDVIKLITNLITNTTPKGSTPTDPFWEKAEGLFLQAIFYYVWLEVPPAQRNFETVLRLIGEAKVSDKGEPSRLDYRMKFLEETGRLKENHPAVKQYNKCMRGAGDTIRSIIISANARLAYLENGQVLRMLSRDDLNLAELGIGVNGDGQTRTALFCVIPDSDKSYNFVIGMLYTQIFQELYRQADFHCGGRLPLHVTFLLDEFANVALPDDYCSLLSTMRSREISSVIIIQNLAQIKALFKETWETIPGNCDTLVYLGGNEQSTHKYVSELLGKATIDKQSNGRTKGRQGSSNVNVDVIGRELMLPDEARKFDNRKCLIFIRGRDPVEDLKFNPFGHAAFSQTEDGGAEPYVHEPGKEAAREFELLNAASLARYEKLKEGGGNVFIDAVKMEDLEVMTELDVSRRFSHLEEEAARESVRKEEGAPLEYADTEEGEDAEGSGEASEGETPHDGGRMRSGKAEGRKPLKGKDDVMTRMTMWNYDGEQVAELKRAYSLKMPMEDVLKFFYPEVPAGEMAKAVDAYEGRAGERR
jgi:type IV secretion system protein VirD4